MGYGLEAMTQIRGGMCEWPEITCLRKCGYHASHSVLVANAGCPPFTMLVWDQLVHDGGPYCPARDIVSEAITQTGLWEPAETALTVALLKQAKPGALVVDMGAHIGWFAMLGASLGMSVHAIEAQRDHTALIRASAALNGFTVDVSAARIGRDAIPAFDAGTPIALAKIDVEGAEAEAVELLHEAIDYGSVASILLEVSPTFRDGYPELVAWLIGRGYQAHETLSEKRIDCLPEETVCELIAGCGQMNVLFTKDGLPS